MEVFDAGFLERDEPELRISLQLPPLAPRGCGHDYWQEGTEGISDLVIAGSGVFFYRHEADQERSNGDNKFRPNEVVVGSVHNSMAFPEMDRGISLGGIRRKQAEEKVIKVLPNYCST